MAKPRREILGEIIVRAMKTAAANGGHVDHDVVADLVDQIFDQFDGRYSQEERAKPPRPDTSVTIMRFKNERTEDIIALMREVIGEDDL